MFNHPIAVFPEPAPNYDYLREYERHPRLIRKFINSTGYRPGVNNGIVIQSLLDQLTEITGIIHSKEILDFFCIYYYPVLTTDLIDEDLKYNVNSRIDELLEMLYEQFSPNPSIDIEIIMEELVKLIGDSFPLSVETFLAARQILEIQNKKLKVKHEKLNSEDDRRFREIDRILNEIVDSPSYPEITPEILDKLKLLWGDLPLSSVINMCESLVQGRLEHSLRKEMFTRKLFEGHYDSIFLLPKEKRDVVFRTFEGEFESDTSMEFETYLEMLRVKGINLTRSQRINLEVNTVDTLRKLRRVFKAFKDITFIRNLPRAEKIDLMGLIYSLKNIEFYDADLSDEEIDMFLNSYSYHFSKVIWKKLDKDEMVYEISVLNRKVELAKRALFSDSPAAVSKVPNQNQLITTSEVRRGQIREVCVELSGLPGTFKSTLLALFNKRTNAYTDDEMIEITRKVIRSGLTSGIDIKRAIDRNTITIESLLRMADILISEGVEVEGESESEEEINAFITEIRTRDVDNPCVVLSRDIFDRSAFFQAMLTSGQLSSMQENSLLNLYLREGYLNHLTERAKTQPDRLTLVVILLAEIPDILKRKKPSSKVNPSFLAELTDKYYSLIYNLTKPSKSNPPLAVLSLNTSELSSAECFQTIINVINQLMGSNADFLMKEA